jgi:hypothetical protein
MFNIFRKLKNTKSKKELTGIIGKYYENDLPVIVRFVKTLPNTAIMNRLPWLTVISWKYDGAERNGMPPEHINNKMIEFEKILDTTFSSNSICKHSYNRTGNNLKEFNYYISNRAEFMKQFNNVFLKKERYPIEIVFYKDIEWTEMKTLIKDFVK